MNETISVIVPVYNTEKFLVKCLNSIINQTYKNLQIIIINDGSNDGSLKLCQEYAVSDSRILLINQQNGGLSVARNNALAHAIGEYIAFVDSDDYIQLDMYEKLLTLMKNNELDVVMCDYNVNGDNVTAEPKLNLDTKQIYNLIVKDKLGSQLWQFLYKSYLWKGILSPKGRYFEDIFILHKVLFKAKKIGRTNEKFYNYYAGRLDNISNAPKNFIKGQLDLATAFFERYDFIVEKGLLSSSSVVLDKASTFATRGLGLRLAQNKQDINFEAQCLIDLLKKHYATIMADNNIRYKRKLMIKLLIEAPTFYKFIWKVKLYLNPNYGILGIEY